MTHQEKPEKDFIESKVGLVQRVMGWKDNDLILAHFRAALQEAVEFGRKEYQGMIDLKVAQNFNQELKREGIEITEIIKEVAIHAYKKELAGKIEALFTLLHRRAMETERVEELDLIEEVQRYILALLQDKDQ